MSLAIAKTTPPLAERVSRHVLEQALAGHYENGRRLTELDLASRLGISRTPVRAALRFLYERTVLDHAPHRGYTLKADRQVLERVREELPQDEEGVLYYRLLRDRLAGRLPAKVNEAELAQAYGVGRTLLRNALTSLLQDGILSGRQYRRWEFADTLDSVDSERESYRFRLIVECSSFREPGFRLDPEPLAACRQRQLALIDHATRHTWMDFFEANAQLHELLAQASGNRFVLNAVRQQNRLRRMSDLADYPLANFELLRKSCHEHLAILDAVQAGELAQAEQLMRGHLERASDWLERRVTGALTGALPGTLTR